MAFVDISSVTLKDSAPTFEKFDVEKNDKALINIPEGKVVQEFVHVFHREEPTMVERNGRQVPEWTRESFAGTYLCLGDFEAVLASPSYGDPDNCPACRVMNKTPRLVERPKRTFAMNIIRYATVKRSYDLRNDNVEVQVWKHGDQRKIEPILTAATKLKELKLGIGEVDFAIEADNSDWKKYLIQLMPGEAQWKGDRETLKSNMDAARKELHTSEQLSEACGKSMTEKSMEAEIDRLMSEYRLEAEGDSGDVFAASSDSSSSDSTKASTDDVDVSDTTTESDLATVDPDDIDAITASMFND